MDFIKELLTPEAYPHPVNQIELIQTHISWVFLTGNFVYKIKKPVNFGFLDFTTLERRRHFCQEELRLNKRLSPEIYLDVIPIVKKGKHYFVGGEGEVVDYAVKMKQLPQETCLISLLENKQLTPKIMDKLTYLMASFYRDAETNAEITSYGTPEKIMINIKENFDQTAPYVGKTIEKKIYDALKGYSFRFLEEKREIFLNRIKTGKIRDGHGDFHCANIYWHNGKIYVLDCIEFNTRFRYADVAADVAFLLMDLDFRKASSFGNRFLNTFLTYTNDFELLEVNDFYKIYRAYVRGKIASFETGLSEIPEAQRQQALERAKAYFNLAYKYLTSSKRPFILATTGLIGSGKSTLATQLAPEINAVVIRSDALRKHLASLRPDEHVYAPFGQGLYSPQMTAKVYKELFRLAQKVLALELPVILDASFSKRASRQVVKELAQTANCPHFFLYCQCPEDILKQRLQQRQSHGEDVSDAHFDLLEAFKRDFDPLLPEENQIIVDTSGDLKQPIEHIKTLLKIN